MSHTAGNKKILSRVKRLKGQLSSLESALTGESECMAILQQVAAIKGATTGLMKDILENHLREHLGVANITQAQREKEVEEVILILKSYLK